MLQNKCIIAHGQSPAKARCAATSGARSGTAANKLFAEDLGRTYDLTRQLNDDRKDEAGDIKGRIEVGRQVTEGVLPSKPDLP